MAPEHPSEHTIARRIQERVFIGQCGKAASDGPDLSPVLLARRRAAGNEAERPGHRDRSQAALPGNEGRGEVAAQRLWHEARVKLSADRVQTPRRPYDTEHRGLKPAHPHLVANVGPFSS